MTEKQPKSVRVAYILAFIFAALSFLTLIQGPTIAPVGGLIYLAGGISMRRGQAWGAYGLALFLTAQCLVAVMLLVLGGGISGNNALGIIALLLVALPVAVICMFAGRILWKNGESNGHAWPWIALTALSTLPLLFFRVYVIPTSSMEDTLLLGDHIVASSGAGNGPKFGDVVIFRYPIDPAQTFLKRVVGVPGDRIKIVHKRLFRNGVDVAEPYAKHTTDYVDSFRDNFPSDPTTVLAPPALDMLKNNVSNGEVIVPEGHYFTLGDNRDNSLDSRYWGFITRRDILGQPILILDSVSADLDEGKRVGVGSTWGKIRWNRLFKRL